MSESTPPGGGGDRSPAERRLMEAAYRNLGGRTPTSFVQAFFVAAVRWPRVLGADFPSANGCRVVQACRYGRPLPETVFPDRRA